MENILCQGENLKTKLKKDSIANSAMVQIHPDTEYGRLYKEEYSRIVNPNIYSKRKEGRWSYFNSRKLSRARIKEQLAATVSTYLAGTYTYMYAENTKQSKLAIASCISIYNHKCGQKEQ